MQDTSLHSERGRGITVYETSKDEGLRLDEGTPSAAALKEECGDGIGRVSCPSRGKAGTVVVDSGDKLQEMIGFGAAFTDAASINFFKLPKAVQEKVGGSIASLDCGWTSADVNCHGRQTVMSTEATH